VYPPERRKKNESRAACSALWSRIWLGSTHPHLVPCVAIGLPSSSWVSCVAAELASLSRDYPCRRWVGPVIVGFPVLLLGWLPSRHPGIPSAETPCRCWAVHVVPVFLVLPLGRPRRRLVCQVGVALRCSPRCRWAASSLWGSPC